MELIIIYTNSNSTTTSNSISDNSTITVRNSINDDIVSEFVASGYNFISDGDTITVRDKSNNQTTITWATTTSTSYPLTIDYNTYCDKYMQSYNKYNKQEEDNNKMNKNFDFGSYKTDNIRISSYGMAINNKSGKWVSYDIAQHRLVDVDILNFEIDPGKIFYKIPKAINKVVPGDIILHNDHPVFVEEIHKDGKFDVINPFEGTVVTIIAPVSPFGFTYVTQIACLLDVLPEASNENPFGSFLPFIIGSDNNNNLGLMMLLMEKDVDIDPLLLLSLSGKSDGSIFLIMKMLEEKKKSKQDIRKILEEKKKSKQDIKNEDNDDALDHMRAMFGPGIEDE